jgi:4-hydroxybenzoate polyprenyltransferase
VRGATRIPPDERAEFFRTREAIAKQAPHSCARRFTAWSAREVGALRTFALVGRLHILVVAALGTLTFGWLFTGEHLWRVVGIAAFDWFVLNLMSRVELVARHRFGLRIFAFAIMSVSFGLFHSYEPTLTLVRLCFFLLGVFYNYPLLPGRLRLKQIYIVRNVASSLCFLLLCFAYPLARAHWGFFGLPIGIEGMTVLIGGVFFFLFELSYEIIEDLRDLPADAAAQVETLPVVLGPELSITIAHQMMVFAAVSLIVGYATHFIPWRMLILAAGPLAQLAMHRRTLRRGVRSGDVVVIAWVGAAMLVLYHAWIFMGGPGLLR